MSLKNKKIIEIFIKESSNKSSEFFMNHLANDVKLNIVGMPAITGKNEFLEAVKMLELMQPSVKIKNIIADDEFVVVESAGKSLNNSFCNIYRFKEDRILELTTYIVDTSLNEL